MPNGYGGMEPGEWMWGTPPTPPTEPTPPTKPRVTMGEVPPGETRERHFSSEPVRDWVMRWPWQTPPGVGFISATTPQVRITSGEYTGLYAPTDWRDVPPTAPTAPPTEPTEPTAPEDVWGELGLAPPPDPLTYAEALTIVQLLGEGYTVGPDPDNPGSFIPIVDPFRLPTRRDPEISPYQQGMLGISGQQLAQQQKQFEEQMAWEQKQFGLQQEAEKQQRLAQLAAQPTSWLQYAAEAGKEPAIQPWMLPLMPQQYSQLQAGGAIPGWTGTMSAEAGQPMTSLPQLTRPSRQYQARMGPAALQQYSGYRQARTGMVPEESEFRLWSQAPPSGRFGGFSRAR